MRRKSPQSTDRDDGKTQDFDSVAAPAAASASAPSSAPASSANHVATDDWTTPGLLRPSAPGTERAQGCCACCSSTLVPAPPLPCSVWVDTPEEKCASAVPRRALVIFNPFSGNGRAQRSLDTVRPALEEAHIELVMAPTQHAHHAFEMMRDRDDLQTFDCVMVIGGDGTMNEVLNGIMSRPQRMAGVPPLALIPGGTGNSVAVSMGIDDPLDAIAPVLRGQLRKVDCGRVTMGERTQYLMNLLGWGLAADATATAEGCRCLGTWRYDFGAVWQILLGSQRQVHIDIDGHVYEGDYCLVLVQNNQHGGARLRFAPYAKLDDGCLDVLLARNDGRGATIALFDEVKRAGCHVYRDEQVVYRRFKRLTLTTPTPTIVNIDGEGGFVTPFTVECVPSAVTMFAAPPPPPL